MERQRPDINSLIGLLLISAILVWFYMSPPPTAEYQETKSIIQNETEDNTIDKSISDVVIKEDYETHLPKSDIYNTKNVEKTTYTLENKNLQLHFSNVGARVTSAKLKNYLTHDSLIVNLLNEDQSNFDIQFYDLQSKRHKSSNLMFDVISKTDSSLTFRAIIYPEKHIQFRYVLKKNNILDLNISTKGMAQILGNENLQLLWESNIPKQEKSLENEQYQTSVYYCFSDNDVSNISERKDDKKTLNEIKWIAFKQQFFSSILINDNVFEKVEVETQTDDSSSNFVKNISATAQLKYFGDEKEIPLKFYYGPNHFKSLKSFDQGFEELIPLGWGLFGWINEYFIIWLFSLLENSNLNYGIIILLIALIIKLLLFPFTYKSYISMAKMRVLKPEIDAINKKYDDPLKKQQATMSLYGKAGASPLGGCLPMLFQLPVLIALFRFFPASIELRQESFLWADDLSTYDSIYDLPFTIPFYGDHISLFTLLMTVSTIIYTKLNSQMTGSANQMPQMKWMMYMMPIVFLGVFNNFAAALSYYYFISNVITFGQQFIIKKFVNDEEVLKRIEEYKKKPKKKSGFQKRLEEMAKQRGYNPPKK